MKKINQLRVFIFCTILFSHISIFADADADADSINITALSEKGIEQWETKIFSQESIYTVVDYKDRLALKAVSRGAASGLIFKKPIDLIKTPYMNWSWLIEKKLNGLNEQSKKGDDYVARIYVVINAGAMIWRVKSLNYVWSSNQAMNKVWNNPFAGSSVKMLSVRGKEDKAGQWYDEKRNVYQDLIDTFGDKGSAEKNKKAYGMVDVIAIMTDTDNSKKDAESYYGDIIFSHY